VSTANLARLHFPPESGIQADNISHRKTPVTAPVAVADSITNSSPRPLRSGFVRDEREQHSYRLADPPALSSGWAPGLTRDYGADFAEMAQNERVGRLMEQLMRQGRSQQAASPARFVGKPVSGLPVDLW
jgi:hypothetical protein